MKIEGRASVDDDVSVENEAVHRVLFQAGDAKNEDTRMMAWCRGVPRMCI